MATAKDFIHVFKKFKTLYSTPSFTHCQHQCHHHHHYHHHHHHRHHHHYHRHHHHHHHCHHRHHHYHHQHYHYHQHHHCHHHRHQTVIVITITVIIITIIVVVVVVIIIINSTPHRLDFTRSLSMVVYPLISVVLISINPFCSRLILLKVLVHKTHIKHIFFV